MRVFRRRGILLTVCLFVFSLLLPGPALADPGSPHGEKQEVGGITVELAFAAEPLKSGRNEIIVRLEDSTHQPVQNTQVIVTLAAHADAAGDDHAPTKKDSHADESDGHTDEPKEYKLKAGHAPGEYEGKLSFPTAGEWEVHVRFTVNGQEREAVFPVDVLPGGKPWLLLGSFFGLNTAIIVTAAFLRANKSKEIS
jgi:hypothetical protein